MEPELFTLESELKKNPKAQASQDDLKALRDWFDKQPHLPPVSDGELLLFLHTCLYRVEPTKVAIDTYFTVRTHAPELFSERTLRTDEIRAAMDVVYQCVLPTKTRDGCTMTIFKLRNPNPKLYSFTANTKLWCAMIESWIAGHGTEEGLYCIMDMADLVMGHLSFNLTFMAKFFVYFQEAMPVKCKGLLFVNASSIMDHVLTIIKPFMKKELIETMKIFKNLEGLQDYIDKDALPKEYGGKGKSLNELQEDTRQMLKTYEKYLLDQEKRQVVESKRPGKAKTESELFGVHGSFKKLDLD